MFVIQKCYMTVPHFCIFVFFSSLLADIHPADSLSLSAQRDDHRVRVVICVADLRVFKDVGVIFIFLSLH